MEKVIIFDNIKEQLNPMSLNNSYLTKKKNRENLISNKDEYLSYNNPKNNSININIHKLHQEETINMQKNEIEKHKKENKDLNNNSETELIKEINIQNKIKNNTIINNNIINSNNNINNLNINLMNKDNNNIYNNNHDLNNYSLNKLSNIVPHIIINDAYCSTETENSFIIINSINGDSYIIYANFYKSIISYNLSKKKIDKDNKTAHSCYISCFQYYYEQDSHQEIIMSLSYLDRNIKLWTFKNWQCIINVKEIYSDGYLYSAYIFNKNKMNYFIVSNFSDKISDYIHPIKVYNYKGRKYKFIQDIKDSNFNTLLVKTFAYNNKIFIVACGEEKIISYNFDENSLYKKYEDNITTNIFSFTIFHKEESIRIISSCDDKYIRIWNFLTGELLNKIKINCIKLRGISIYDEKNLFVGCGDNSIKLVELEKNSVSKSFEGHEKKITSIKIQYIKNFGKCIFSHGYDDKIILWN